MAAMLRWTMWNDRHSALWGKKKHFFPTCFIAYWHLKEWSNVQQQTKETPHKSLHPPPHSHWWKKPLLGWLKCHIDTFWRGDTMGVGFVVMDVYDIFLEARNATVGEFWDAFMVEVLWCHFCLWLSCEWRFQRGPHWNW